MTLKFASKPANKTFNSFMDDFVATMPSILRDDFVTPNAKASVPVNIIETQKDYVLEVVAPGFQKEDFRISLDNKTLTVLLEVKERQEQTNERFIRKEYRFKSFSRSFTIDEKIDAEGIVAKYQNGVLTLNLPKKDAVKAASKEIAIQ